MNQFRWTQRLLERSCLVLKEKGLFSPNVGHVSERGTRGRLAQSTCAHTARNDHVGRWRCGGERTVRTPRWWQHDDCLAEPDERKNDERHKKKRWRNVNRRWRIGRRTDASYRPVKKTLNTIKPPENSKT